MKNDIKHILFIDDEPNILEMLGRLLSQCEEDWEATFCLGVSDALSALEQQPFDTVVSDIRMPGKDGFDLLRAMRENPALHHIPVIMLTGEVDRSYKRKALNLGATDLLNKPIGRDDLIARLRSALRLKSYHDQLQDQVAILDGLVRERTRELEWSRREVVWRLAKAGEYRDDQTGDHVARVSGLACILAEELGMGKDFLELLFQTSPLHDIGKIGIPDTILLKAGPLTPEERLVIEQHAVIGEEILHQAPKNAAIAEHIGQPLEALRQPRSSLLEMASAIARHHHEKWDGSGYPDRLAGDAIPIAARIVALADVYDALTTERPYKKPMPEGEACALIIRESGIHFDPTVVDAFKRGIGRAHKLKGNYSAFSQSFGLAEVER